MEMAKDRVEVVAISTIVPSYPTACFFHPFSHVVATTKDMYMHIVYHFPAAKELFCAGSFPSGAGAAAGKAIESLKVSLSAVLSHYPLLCGRLRARERGGFAIKCNDAGVRCLEATTGSSLGEWITGGDGAFQKELCASEANTKDFALNSLAMVQFTEFSCGGLAIAISWSLAVADAFSINLFMKSWGEVHRGHKISTPPVIPSHLEESDDAEFNSRHPLPEPSIHHVFFPEKQQPPEANRLHSLKIHLSEKVVQFLNRGVHKDSPETGSSQNDDLLAVTAWLWRSMCRARGQPTSCMIASGNRSNLAEGFFGVALRITSVSDDCTALNFSQTVNLLRQRLEGEKREVSTITTDLAADDEIVCYWVDFWSDEVEFSFGKAMHVTWGVETSKGRGSMVIVPRSRAGVDDPKGKHAIAAAILVQPQHFNILVQQVNDDLVMKL